MKKKEENSLMRCTHAGTRTQTEMTLHEKAVRLCEGGVVEVAGHFVRAKRYEWLDSPCDYCDMDSACTKEMASLCAECDLYELCSHILVFAYLKR